MSAGILLTPPGHSRPTTHRGRRPPRRQQQATTATGEEPMAINYRRLDAFRRGRSEHENHLIDGLVAGRVSRREFLRHGSVLGLSLPFLGTVATAVGYAVTARPARAGTPGGTI